jgi:hypothetical protein
MCEAGWAVVAGSEDFARGFARTSFWSLGDALEAFQEILVRPCFVSCFCQGFARACFGAWGRAGGISGDFGQTVLRETQHCIGYCGGIIEVGC